MKILMEYAMRHVGLPYRWGGDDPIEGYDCSGLVQELLASVGVDPRGDQTAMGLYQYFRMNGVPTKPKAGALAFYGTKQRITHVGFCIGKRRMIEAGGGGSRTHDRRDVARQNAYVRIRPITNRKDLVAILMPKYF